MENTLKRLLTVEIEAEQLVAQAQTEREQIIQQALQSAHQAEQAFQAKVPELQANWIAKAEARADQAIAELSKRYEEKQQYIRQLAEENQDNALTAAIHLFMQVGQ